MTSRLALEPSLPSIFDEAADTVYSFLLRRCGDRAVAEDLTGATFEAASRRFDQGRGHEVTVAWLVTVARRRLIDHWRMIAAHERGLDRLARGVATTTQDRPGVDTSVDEALASLSTRYRAALSLRYLDDLSVSEVADALGLTYKATESLLFRARAAFAAAYGDDT